MTEHYREAVEAVRAEFQSRGLDASEISPVELAELMERASLLALYPTVAGLIEGIESEGERCRLRLAAIAEITKTDPSEYRAKTIEIAKRGLRIATGRVFDD